MSLNQDTDLPNQDVSYTKEDIDLALKTILLLIEWDVEEKKNEIRNKEAA